MDTWYSSRVWIPGNNFNCGRTTVLAMTISTFYSSIKVNIRRLMPNDDSWRLSKQASKGGPPKSIVCVACDLEGLHIGLFALVVRISMRLIYILLLTRASMIRGLHNLSFGSEEI